MSERPGGDVHYGRAGEGYARYRRPDARIAALVSAALGTGPTVVNVGAGAGSYEPRDRRVAAVEPSVAMRAQRPPGRPPAIDAVAEALPFADNTFDAALATFFGEAYYGRPEALLDPAVRRAQSAWSFVTPEAVTRFETALSRDLRDGTWDERHGRLRTRPTFDGSLVLVRAGG